MATCPAGSLLLLVPMTKCWVAANWLATHHSIHLVPSGDARLVPYAHLQTTWNRKPLSWMAQLMCHKHTTLLSSAILRKRQLVAEVAAIADCPVIPCTTATNCW